MTPNAFLVWFGLFIIAVATARRAIEFGGRSFDEVLGLYTPPIDPHLKVPIPA